LDHDLVAGNHLSGFRDRFPKTEYIISLIHNVFRRRDLKGNRRQQTSRFKLFHRQKPNTTKRTAQGAPAWPGA
jgi:hypothetical protein